MNYVEWNPYLNSFRWADKACLASSLHIIINVVISISLIWWFTFKLRQFNPRTFLFFRLRSPATSQVASRRKWTSAHGETSRQSWRRDFWPRRQWDEDLGRVSVSTLAQDLQKLNESQGGGAPQLILEEMLHGLDLSTAAFNSHELTVLSLILLFRASFSFSDVQSWTMFKINAILFPT